MFSKSLARACMRAHLHITSCIRSSARKLVFPAHSQCGLYGVLRRWRLSRVGGLVAAAAGSARCIQSASSPARVIGGRPCRPAALAASSSSSLSGARLVREGELISTSYCLVTIVTSNLRHHTTRSTPRHVVIHYILHATFGKCSLSVVTNN